MKMFDLRGEMSDEYANRITAASNDGFDAMVKHMEGLEEPQMRGALMVEALTRMTITVVETECPQEVQVQMMAMIAKGILGKAEEIFIAANLVAVAEAERVYKGGKNDA